ncbi:hypothetical protein JCM18899A_15620 [Nocardioides sp. AN3]
MSESGRTWPVSPLTRVRSVKVKLGLLVAASVVVAVAVTMLGSAGGVPMALSIPVTILLALAVTQLLAVGMTSPLREMTAAAGRMATGDYAVRVTATSSDEVGELARAFNTMARDLRSVDQQRRDLVANVSHELRTPLTALSALLENLVDGVAPTDPATLESALAQTERLSGLVGDLLDLARVDAGKAPLSPVPVALAPLLADAVTEAETATGALGRAVTYDVEVPDGLVVRADPDRLHQLVANLLDNASRHSPADGVVRVVVSASMPDADGRYRLEVHDAGPGIAAADRERVFEPFGTLSTTSGGGGTGLGLAIARWVTELHGGVIGFVDPEDGAEGARVRVDLPLQPPDRPAVTQEAPMPPPSTRDTPPAIPAGPSGASPASPVPPRPMLDDVFGSFWPEHGVAARPPVLGAALGVGLLAAIVLPFRELGIGTALVLLVAGGVVLSAAKDRRDPFTVTCAALCALLGGAAAVRAADWIVVLCLLAGAVVCACGVARGRTLPGFVLACVSWPLAGIRGLPWLGRTAARVTGLGQGAALLRTLVLSLVGLLVFGLLLGSADAVLARWVRDILPELSVDTLVLRAFVLIAVSGTVLAAAYLALNPPHVDRAALAPRPVKRRYEWLAPVLVVDAVFAAFLVAQAAAFFGGQAYVRTTTGLTYADYVHQGFGQLTVATALTLVVIAAAARKAPRETASDRGWLRVALGVLCAETLVVVWSALYRMHLYQQAYGFTRLRLLVDVFEGWLGIVLVLVAAAGLALRSAWLPRAALLSGVVALLGLAAVNPDAWIAQRNLDRYADTGRVDWGYLRLLSADAVPTLAAGDADCALLGRGASDDDWLEWNLGRARAEVHLLGPLDATSASVCASTGAD